MMINVVGYLARLLGNAHIVVVSFLCCYLVACVIVVVILRRYKTDIASRMLAGTLTFLFTYRSLSPTVPVGMDLCRQLHQRDHGTDGSS